MATSAARRVDLPTEGLCWPTQKLRYANNEIAIGAMNLLRAADVDVVRAYACPWCSRWHLTSQREALA